MLTEEIKTEGFAERIEKAKLEIIDAMNEIRRQRIAFQFIGSIFGVVLFFVSNNEPVLVGISILFLIISLVSVNTMFSQDVKSTTAFHKIVINIDAIYTKKQSVEESLKILGNIYSAMSDMENIEGYLYFGALSRFLKRINELGPESGRIEDIKVTNKKEIMELLLGVLFDLREDMIESLKQNETALIQAKAEVSTHVNGTNILNQVSEVQVIRLEKQIEQFQELQRILVVGK